MPINNINVLADRNRNVKTSTRSSRSKVIDYKSYKQYHGIHGDSRWAKPLQVTSCATGNRSDQGNHTRSDEFLDTPEVLRAKVRKLAAMIREAKTTTCYTGAGLSKSSGIPDYATKAKNSIAKVKKISKSSEAEPTYAHHVLAAMEKKGYIQHYVQQNHDGLPQKAGFPQTKMNEIHGAWFDPSNPVIMFSGNLRGDLFEDLEEIEYKSTLCLCLGTSLSGMNADRTADTPAERAVVDGEEGIQGTVVINIQKTRLDKAGHCSLRVWGLLDDVFKLLAEELQLNVQPRDYRTMFNIPPNDPALLQDQYYVPYNKKGQYDPNSRMLLDLRPNMPFVIPNPESSYHKRTGFVRGRSAHGDFDLKIDQCKYRKRLGKWWIQDLIDGVPAYINLMNTNASVVTIS